MKTNYHSVFLQKEARLFCMQFVLHVDLSFFLTFCHFVSGGFFFLVNASILPFISSEILGGSYLVMKDILF